MNYTKILQPCQGSLVGTYKPKGKKDRIINLIFFLLCGRDYTELKELKKTEDECNDK